MKKFALVLLATAAISMQSCARQQEQQSENQAQSQNNNESAPTKPNEGRPPGSNESTANKPNEGQAPTGNEGAPIQPNGSQPPSSNERAANQPNEAQPPSSNESAPNKPSEAQPPSSNESAPNKPSEGQPSTSNESAQNPLKEGQLPTNNQIAPNQPNESQPISPDDLSREEVRQVQKALNKSGFYAGAANGHWGSEASDALKRFQQSKNIQANGKLDQETLSGLGLNEAQFAQQNRRNSKSHRSVSRPVPSLHPSALVKARKGFQSPVSVSTWQAKSSPNLPRRTFSAGGRRHAKASPPWRLIVVVPNAVFVGGTYVGSDPDPNIRAALRRDFGTR